MQNEKKDKRDIKSQYYYPKSRNWRGRDNDELFCILKLSN